MLAGIYIIENILSGKKYIGQGIDVKRRMWAKHANCLIVQNAIKKYGRKKFKRHILIYCEIFELDRLEIECIKIFDSLAPNGYNILPGGLSGNRGIKKSLELIEKNRIGHLGIYPSEETRKLLSELRSGENHPRYGTKLSNASSPYHGVSRHVSNGKDIYWGVADHRDKKNKYLSSHKIEEDAAHAYDKYIVEHNFPNILNFPENYPNRKEGK